VKAVVIEEPGKFAVRTVDDPAPGELDAIVKVEACGICGTDIHVLRGEFAPTRYPIIPGHEFCGEVVEVGSVVTNLSVGDFVAVDPSLFCGHCRMCRLGRFNLCENWNAVGVGSVDGACAELVKVPSASAFPVGADFPRNWATLVEPLSCAVHGLDQFGPKPADNYLIYGAGTMGLLLAQLIKHNGAGGLDMVETNQARHALARRLAADRVAVSADDLDRPKGWDVVIDATGVVDRLESTGAVRRRSHPQDRRVKRVELTDDGRRLRVAFWEKLTNRSGPLGRLSGRELTSLRSLLLSAVRAPSD